MEVRTRAIILGLVLVPVNCAWLSQMEMATQYSAGYGGGPYPTTFSLFANVIFILVWLSVLNAALHGVKPEWALRRNELLVIYVMLCIASAVDAIDCLDVLFPMLTHLHRYNDPLAGRPYDREIMPYVPEAFVVSNAEAVRAWHEGGEGFWTLQTVNAWMRPLLLWGAFLCVMLWVMLCLAELMRTKWIEQERLSYPITHIPLQIADPRLGLFRGHVFWYGFAIAAGISLLNGLSVQFPGIPSVRVKYWDLSPYFVGRPWNAMGWTPISFYPFGVGLGYLLPPDLLFSSWFFYWFIKGERILAAAVGWLGYDAQAPYIEQQGFGAYMYVATMGLWLGRRYFVSVFREKAVHRPVLGALGGMVVLTGFFIYFGMSPWLAVTAWLIYWLLAISVTRMRAELGPPAHDLHRGGPDYILTSLLGTRMIHPRDLSLLSWFYWFNRAYRSLAMPHMLEGFALARRQGFSDRVVSFSVLLAGVVGTYATFVALAYFGYARGAEAKMAWHATGFGWEAFNRLRGWLHNATPPNPTASGAVLGGLVFAAGLHQMTTRFLWWPLHPLGFAIAGSYSMATMWCPMLIAWVAKVSLLRLGGQSWYMRAVPFFVGLLIGDYLMGCSWPIVGWITARSMYSFQQ
ncbi:MAG: DUF6785 family protein [Candidatus Zipacnadales bacterium]